jgi:hypothetical protein
MGTKLAIRLAIIAAVLVCLISLNKMILNTVFVPALMVVLFLRSLIAFIIFWILGYVTGRVIEWQIPDLAKAFREERRKLLPPITLPEEPAERTKELETTPPPPPVKEEESKMITESFPPEKIAEGIRTLLQEEQS